MKKNILTCVLAVAVFASCSDWTEPESIRLTVPSVKDKNPELYEAYMQSLRDYRNSEHDIMIVKYDNVAETPKHKSEHLNALPDSIDYVVLTNPMNLSDVVLKEMGEIREKGTRILYEVNFEYVQKTLYPAYCEKWAEDHAPQPETEEADEIPSEPSDEMLSLEEFTSLTLDNYFALYASYGYDGVIACYNGRSPISIPDDQEEALRTEQNLFFGKLLEWKTVNPDAVMMFEGCPENLLDKVILDDFKYIILSAHSVSSKEGLSYMLRLASAEGVPTDRFIMDVTTVSLTDGRDKRGYFVELDETGEPVRAIIGTAEWMASSISEGNKCGMCVTNVKNDFFHSDGNAYGYVKRAIQIMNPSISY